MSKYLIYSSPGCGYCLQAKRVLASKGLEYDYIDLVDVDDADKAQLQESAGRPFRTVPQIFKETDQGLQYIGGYTDLMAYLKA